MRVTLCTLAREMHAQKGELWLFRLIWYTLTCIFPIVQPDASVLINLLSKPCNCSILIVSVVNPLILLHQL